MKASSSALQLFHLCLVLLMLLLGQTHGQPVSNGAVDTSCSEDRRAALLENMSNDKHLAYVEGKFGGEKYCGYYTINLLVSPPTYDYDDSYKFITNKTKTSPPCTTYALKTTFLDKNGKNYGGETVQEGKVKATAPGKVDNLEAHLTDNGEINLTWKPSSTSCPVKKYRVTYEYTQLQDINVESKTTELEVYETNSHLDDVVSNAIYEFCVSCVSDEEDGQKACTKIRTPAEVLPAPRNLLATGATTSSFEVSWQHPIGDVTVYKYELSVTQADEGGAPVRKYLLSGRITSQIVDGLLPGTEYRFEVGAVDSSGNIGRKASTTSRTATPEPSKPSNYIKRDIVNKNDEVDTDEIVEDMLEEEVEEESGSGQTENLKGRGGSSGGRGGSSGGRGSYGSRGSYYGGSGYSGQTANRVTMYSGFFTISLALGLALV